VLRHRWPTGWTWVKALAWSLIASDVIHHFAVLWPIEGSPEFDIWYQQ
jgi:hypothetical protein